MHILKYFTDSIIYYSVMCSCHPKFSKSWQLVFFGWTILGCLQAYIPNKSTMVWWCIIMHEQTASVFAFYSAIVEFFLQQRGNILNCRLTIPSPFNKLIGLRILTSLPFIFIFMENDGCFTVPNVIIFKLCFKIYVKF
jgi:hypothetical protein